MGPSFLSYIKSIRVLDVFDRPVKLLLNKEESHKTIFGAFLTILLMGVVSSSLLYNLVELIKKESPNSFQSEIEISSPPAHKLIASNFTVQLAFVNSKGSPYIDETIYKLRAYLVERIITVEDGNLNETKSKTVLPMIRCNLTQNYQPALETYYQAFDQHNSYCIDWEKISDLELQGSYDAQKYQYIKFEFRLCENESLAIGDQPCQSQEAMKEYLMSNNFQMQFTSINFDLTNYEKPHIQSGQDVFTTISSNVFKKMEIYMQPVETQTDEGILNSKIKKQTALKYLNYIEMTDFDLTTQLMNVSIRLSKVELVNHRSYKKLQTLLGEAGGLWQILFTAILLVQNPLSRLSYQLKLLNALFNFEGEESSHLDTLHRISSLRQINFQLNSPCIGAKEKLLSNVRNTILNFFKTISYKIKLKPLEFIAFYRERYNVVKSQQIEYAKKKLEKSLDILYIINKLQEIDKLKMILLTVPQIKLFDFLPKPTIYCNQFSDSQKNQQQYFSVLSPQISYYQKSVEARNAFAILLQYPHEEINKKLIQMMHPSIIELLNEINTPELLNFNKNNSNIEVDAVADELF